MHSASMNIFSLLAMAGLILAQTSVVTLYVPDADPQPLVASIIGSDATATTYALQCAPGTDGSDCGFDGVVTLTEGPSTAQYTFPAELGDDGSVAFTGYMDCSLAGTVSAVCIESAGGSDVNFPGITTNTYTGTDQPYIPVTITAAAVGSASTSAAASVTSTSAASNTGSATGVGSTSGASSTSTGTTSTSGSGSSSAAAQTTSSKAASSTAGGLALAGDLKWVVGGAAAAMAMIA
ncbi:hypothetical protein B7494_g968 [Chlorociboria aeruginascens]|nr:hypothetical protein B7494_g968 [Chlorociboria aeruginascens]